MQCYILTCKTSPTKFIKIIKISDFWIYIVVFWYASFLIDITFNQFGAKWQIAYQYPVKVELTSHDSMVEYYMILMLCCIFHIHMYMQVRERRATRYGSGGSYGGGSKGGDACACPPGPKGPRGDSGHAGAQGPKVITTPPHLQSCSHFSFSVTASLALLCEDYSCAMHLATISVLQVQKMLISFY